MIFPEHMEFRYYITPERKECYEEDRMRFL